MASSGIEPSGILSISSELPGLHPLDVAQCVRLVRRVRVELVDVGGSLEAIAQRREKVETVDDHRDHQAVDAVEDEVPVLGRDLPDKQLEQVIEDNRGQTAAEQQGREVVMEVEHTSHGCRREGAISQRKRQSVR